MFNEKIEVTGAQAGYFVAREFTQDAVNQAKQFPGITLHVVEEKTEFETDALMLLQYVSIDSVSYQASILPSPTHQIENVLNTILTLQDGREVAFDVLCGEKYHAFNNKTAKKNDAPDVRLIVSNPANYEIVRFEILNPKINGEQYLYLALTCTPPQVPNGRN